MSWNHGINKNVLENTKNPGVKQAAYVNELRRMAGMFKYKTDENVLHNWSEKLSKTKINYNTFEQAIEHFIDTAHTMPSYSEFKGYIDMHAPDRFSTQVDMDVVNQDKEYEKLRDQFIETMGEETLKKMGKWYFEKVCGLDQEILDELRKLGFEYEDYQRPFLFDWKATGFTKDGEKLLKQCILRYNEAWESR